MRHNHHEAALNLGGFIITIAPVLVATAQAVAARRKRRGRKQ